MYSVKLSPEFNEEFVRLQQRAEKGNGEATYLLKIVDKGIAKVATKVTAGKKIPGNLWPKEYIKKYGINNLWKLDLDNYWRMLYTIVGDQVELIGIVLDVMGHKKYDRKFGYKTS
ncbi:MAG: hypothetical protein KAW41_04560 [Candidatus Diapherotrites archaeon]|nr:hypothetical protein [Candidatus Diapherotrites archaeon]